MSSHLSTCDIIRFNDDRYPCTCDPFHKTKRTNGSGQMSEVKNLRTNAKYRETAERLITLNLGRPGLQNCRTVNCTGIACINCPLHQLSTAGDTRRITYNTLGELRGAMDRIKSGGGTALIKPAQATIEEPKDSEGVGVTANDVHQPSHYKLFQDIESIEVIARSMTVEQFRGFCFGNILKYRLRAGKKSELATMEKDLAKASFYETLFEQHKDKCHA